MRVGLDTAVVLRLLVGEPAPLARAAWRAVADTRAAGGEAVVSDLVVNETYFALQHHYKVPKEEALKQLRALFDADHLSSVGRAAEVVTTPRLAGAKPGFVDRMIHANAHLRDRRPQAIAHPCVDGPAAVNAPRQPACVVFDAIGSCRQRYYNFIAVHGRRARGAELRRPDSASTRVSESGIAPSTSICSWRFALSAPSFPEC